MSRLTVVSCDKDGTSNPVVLDSLARIDSLHVVQGRNGPRSAAWNLNVTAGFNHPALNVGRWIYIYNGAWLQWSGRLLTPGRDTPWQCEADGIASEAVRFQAYAPTTGNALNLSEVITAAQTRGLRWTVSGTLPSITDASLASGVTTLDDALSTVANNLGYVWSVTPAGVLTMTAPPTTATHLLYATDPAGGRTAVGYVSTVIVSYMNQTTRALTTTVITAGQPAGPFEGQLDITDQGFITAGNAAAQAASYLAAQSPRTKYTGTFTVTGGQVRSLGGVPQDIATVPGTAKVRVLQVEPDRANELDLTTPTELLLDSVDYDVDADTANIQPLDAVA